MKINQFLYIAGFAALVAACSSDDAATTETAQERVPISLSYQTLKAVDDSRRAAAATDLNDDYIASGRSVNVSIANVGSNTWQNYTYTTGDAGAMTPPSGDGTPLYPTDNTNIKILAWHPADAASSGFEVQYDQTSYANYQASDLMFSNNVTNQAKQVDPVALQFVHKMAKIVVNVTSGIGVSEIRSVTLKNIHRTLSLFDQSDGTVTTKTSDAAGDVLVVKEGTEATAAGAALIPDQTISGSLLEITTDIGTATYSVDSKHFESGHKYTLNISVSRTTVNTTTAITNWGAGGSVTINSQGSPFMTFTVGGVSFKMVYVEGGENVALKFGVLSTNGAPGSFTYRNITVAEISDYYIGQTEVTNGLWYAVMGSKPPVWSNNTTNNGQPSQADNFPVAYVSWDEICMATTGFIDKLNELAAGQLPTGMKFALTSEVQWQYAAIGGKYTNGYIYSGSSTWGDSAWNLDNGGRTTHAVATKPANELGIYDMSGNVWEWCYDAPVDLTEGDTVEKDYVCTSGSSRVLRGGSWVNASADAAYLYPSYRYPYASSNRIYNVGFRLALR